MKNSINMNMKEISIEESKKIQIDILKNFIEFCDKNNLSYFMAYGSLIGAIRHQGFIPWDDDIDVQMPRADYEKLINLYNKNNKSDKYCLVSPYDKKSQHSYVKIIDTQTIKIERGVSYKNGYLGIDIDVYPIDGLPNTKPEYDKFFNQMQKLYKKFAYSKTEFNGKDLKERLLRIYKIFLGDGRRFLKKAETKLKQYPFKTSEFVGTLISFYDYYNDYHEKKDYESYVLVPFEGIKVRAPIGYDNILRNIYGDYLKLPPIEQQVTHHSYSIYWKD